MYKKSVEQAEIRKKVQQFFFYQSGDERIHYFFNQLSREQRQSFELYLEYATKQAPFDELQKMDGADPAV